MIRSGTGGQLRYWGGGPRKLFKAFRTVFGDRETRYPYTSFVYHGRGKEDLLSEGNWVLK